MPSAVEMRSPDIPDRFLFQWHITERCNLRCNHCYQESSLSNDLPYDTLTGILLQFSDFITQVRDIKARPIRAHITVTGGEPFVRQDFPALLGRIAERKNLWSFAILSNGTLIDSRCAADLAILGPQYVQVSIEGNQEIHDRIRGAGSYRLAVRGLEQLVRHQIPTTISFTVSRDNLDQFPAVAKLARSLGVKRLWADRMIPVGGSASAIERMLSPHETMTFFETMATEKRRISIASTEISMHRALQFMAGNGTPYRCSAGHSLITILPDGGLIPCRRMPLRAGNILNQPLSRLYFSAPVFQALRERHRVPRGCETCFYSDLCNGGLKCLSSALHGDPFVADPGCWLKGASDPPDADYSSTRQDIQDCHSPAFF